MTFGNSAVVLAAVGALMIAPRASAAEFGDNTPYYEDDAWYDVTEWFDGNDYNPTDEAWWRWDDEAYEVAEDTSSDHDSENWYGYTARGDDDWYYDYYDPLAFSYYDDDADGLYDYGYRYYDYDNDGFYDAYAWYSDENGDGVYDEYDYYSFNDAGSTDQKGRADDQLTGESREATTTGKIRQMKTVQVRGGKQHVVVSIQPESGDQDRTVIADLGSASAVKAVNPKLGARITVEGPRSMVGKHRVVLASSFELNGTTRRVDRSPRSTTGKVVGTHTTAVRGTKHLMAMVETNGNRLAVDLGPADRLKMKIGKGAQLTFRAVPVKVKGTPLMIAQTVEVDGRKVVIDRQRKPESRAAMKKAG